MTRKKRGCFLNSIYYVKLTFENIQNHAVVNYSKQNNCSPHPVVKEPLGAHIGSLIEV